MDDQKKFSLKETKEAHAFLMQILTDLQKHKADDGKIDTKEWIQTAISNAPAGLKAVMGADRIDDELKDLDEQETKEVAAMGVDLMRALVSIFMPELA